MTQHVKIAGVWKTVVPYVNAGGTWKTPNYVLNRQNGKWNTSYVKGGFADIAWNNVDEAVGPWLSNSVLRGTSQSDGKIILTGSFSTVNESNSQGIVRLNSDFTLDTGFTTNVGTGANSADTKAVAVQSDGKILVGGDFTSWNGTSLNRIVRLNSDGTRDTTFSTNVGVGPNNTINFIALQSDGKILVGGLFTTWSFNTVGRIVRLNSDGTRDTTFTTNNGTGAGAGVDRIAVQSDEKILVGGFFTAWNGVTVGRIVRLNSDGTRDTAFTTSVGAAANNNVRAITVQSDGKILVGGNFTTWNGVTVKPVIRLNSDGTMDSSFNSNISTFSAVVIIYDAVVQADGKIYVGARFDSYNGVSQFSLLRLNSDGTSDTTFNTNVGTNLNTGFSAQDVRGIIVLADSRLFVFGTFAQYQNIQIPYFVLMNSNGTVDSFNSFTNGVFSAFVQADGKMIVSCSDHWNNSVKSLVRLNYDGTLDTSFSTAIGTGPFGSARTIVRQPDGKLVLGGFFSSWNGTTGMGHIARLNSDLSLDTSFKTNTGTGANSTIRKIIIQPTASANSNKILAVGDFTSWNGTASVNRIVQLNTDGTRDNTYNPPGGAANNGILDAAIQSDYKVILGGFFTTWAGVTVNRIVRINNDSGGTRDTTFTTNVGTGANSSVNSIALQSDGKILVGGAFTTWGGVTVGRIVRLNSDGTRDTTFTTNVGTGAGATIDKIYVHTDGKIIVSGSFTTWNGTGSPRFCIGLNSDGTNYTQFNTNLGSGFSVSAPNVIELAPNNKLIVGGFFESFNKRIRRSFMRIGIEAA